MTSEDIVTLISSIGVPAALCFYTLRQIDPLRDTVKSLEVAITKLSTLIDVRTNKNDGDNL